MSLSADIRNYTSKKPVVYVTRDIERALGLEPKDGYFVISNDSQLGRETREKYPESVWLIDDPRGDLDTYDLLLIPKVGQIIAERAADVMVFQNTARIERLCKEKGWGLINPPASLSQKVEEKISQVTWLEEDASLLPPHRLAVLRDVLFEDRKFVLQFNHSHTGQGTYIIENKTELDSLKAKFPDRPCRIVNFIEGPVFTANVIVADDILVGNTSYQITGLPPFTDLPFSTIGNDWSLPHSPEYKSVLADTRNIAVRVGKRLKTAGWRGLFGIDVIYDDRAGKTSLLEINARQPASTVFESTLQKQAFPGDASIFEVHMAALLSIATSKVEFKPLCSGAQIVARVTEPRHTADAVTLRAKGLVVVEYKNDASNKELFRIQTSEGIMDAHGKLGNLGKFITTCIK